MEGIERKLEFVMEKAVSAVGAMYECKLKELYNQQ